MAKDKDVKDSDHPNIATVIRESDPHNKDKNEAKEDNKSRNSN